MKSISEGKHWFKVSFSVEEQPQLTHYMPVAADSAVEACQKVEELYETFDLCFLKVEKQTPPEVS